MTIMAIVQSPYIIRVLISREKERMGHETGVALKRNALKDSLGQI
jgi:hypothetical protein